MIQSRAWFGPERSLAIWRARAGKSQELLAQPLPVQVGGSRPREETISSEPTVATMGVGAPTHPPVDLSTRPLVVNVTGACGHLADSYTRKGLDAAEETKDL